MGCYLDEVVLGIVDYHFGQLEEQRIDHDLLHLAEQSDGMVEKMVE